MFSFVSRIMQQTMSNLKVVTTKITYIVIGLCYFIKLLFNNNIIVFVLEKQLDMNQCE